jgi:hypothetical protein
MNQLQRLFTCLHTSKLDGFVGNLGDDSSNPIPIISVSEKINHHLKDELSPWDLLYPSVSSKVAMWLENPLQMELYSWEDQP